jgi:hypothetical protein
MSSPGNSESWIENWWPLFVILYGVLFLAILVSFKPMT